MIKWTVVVVLFLLPLAVLAEDYYGSEVSSIYESESGVPLTHLQKDYIDTLRKENNLEKLLESPVDNYIKICRLFMRHFNPNLEQDVDTVKRRMEKDGIAIEEAAALAVMFAEGSISIIWRIPWVTGEQYEAIEQRWKELPKLLLPILLDAYTRLPKECDDSLVFNLRWEISRLLRGEFDESTRKLIIEKYIDSPNRPYSPLDDSHSISLYRRLGLMDRIRNCFVPPGEIEDNDKLFKTMQLALQSKGEFAAAPYAEEWLVRYGKSNKSGSLLGFGKVMANENPAKALELLPEYAETDPWLLIELHKAAGKIGAVKEKRYKWLEKYAAEADKKANEINVNGVSIRLKEYQHGILSLQGYSDYDGMLFLFAAMEKTTSESDKKARDYWDVLTSKGLALRRLGRKDEAIAVYTHIKDNAPNDSWGQQEAATAIKTIQEEQ